jgi:hypothetical protein
MLQDTTDPAPYRSTPEAIMRELLDTHAIEAYLADNLASTKVERDEAMAEVERYQTKARNASDDAGRRLRLLAEIHGLLRAGRTDEAIGVIVGEAERSPALAERIGVRRLT